MGTNMFRSIPKLAIFSRNLRALPYPAAIFVDLDHAEEAKDRRFLTLMATNVFLRPPFDPPVSPMVLAGNRRLLPAAASAKSVKYGCLDHLMPLAKTHAMAYITF